MAPPVAADSTENATTSFSWTVTPLKVTAGERPAVTAALDVVRIEGVAIGRHPLGMLTLRVRRSCR
jgi:hypothetical protein